MRGRQGDNQGEEEHTQEGSGTKGPTPACSSIAVIGHGEASYDVLAGVDLRNQQTLHVQGDEVRACGIAQNILSGDGQ